MWRSDHGAIPWILIVLVGPLMDTGRMSAQAANFDGILSLTTVDELTGQALPVRMELRNRRGRPIKIKAENVVSRDDYIVFDGQVDLELRQGAYEFTIEAGPEYQTRLGHFTIEKHAQDAKQIVLRRQVQMSDEGWWAGDLDVKLPPGDVALLTAAARIEFAPLTVVSNTRGKCWQNKGFEKNQKRLASYLGPLAALDHGRGGGLLYFGTALPTDVCQRQADESSLQMLNRAVTAKCEAIALTPFAWDLPLWIASEKLTAIQVIHRHALVDGVADNEDWGRPRDEIYFPGKLGNGRYSEVVYHHVLNCGLRIPPAAGSGAGFNKNPVGANRVYVHCGEQYSPQEWIAGLRAGRVIVTNGPLLRTSVSGSPPGHVFRLREAESREFQIALQLTFYQRSPVEYLEIVKNGRVQYEIRLDELVRRRGVLPPVEFDESGWFLVRAVTDNTQTYQFASTGPYYVEANSGPRISRASVRYFLDWLDDAATEFADQPEVVSDIEAARPFWDRLLAMANAD